MPVVLTRQQQIQELVDLRDRGHISFWREMLPGPFQKRTFFRDIDGGNTMVMLVRGRSECRLCWVVSSFSAPNRIFALGYSTTITHEAAMLLADAALANLDANYPTTFNPIPTDDELSMLRANGLLDNGAEEAFGA